MTPAREAVSPEIVRKKHETKIILTPDPSRQIIERLMNRPKPSSQKDLNLRWPSNESLGSNSLRRGSPKTKSGFWRINSSGNMTIGVAGGQAKNGNLRLLGGSVTKESLFEMGNEFMVIEEDFWCKTEMMKRRLSV